MTQYRTSTQLELLRQVTFIRPFCRTDPSNRLIPEIVPYLSMVYDDNDVLTAVKELERIFLERQECLVHGDMHAGSVMIKGDDVKVSSETFSDYS